ncbi:hypothetical protein V495_00113, partial [Pseudogymnoascus sp. VKM F-4514 (FW-929)]
LLFTPQKPRVIGPTPQKDGKFLGIFDAMPSGDEISPFKQPSAPTNNPGIQETPRKTKNADDGIMATPSAARHSRTPQSSSKRFLLDTFVTPLKRRRGSNEGSAKKASLTPSSVSKLNLSTPSFLRRDNRIPALPAISEDATDALSPPAPRLPKRSLVRGLSSMLASLRELQEEALDDDLDALREMESGPPPPNAGPKQAVLPKPQAPKLQESVQVGDSQQLTDFPFIDFPDLDFNNDGKDAEEALGEREQAIADRDSKLPVYKKKGQKRTTRKVNIRPVRAKAPAKEAAPTTYSDSEGDEYADGQEDTQDGDTQNPDVVPDTQEGFEADSLPLYKAVQEQAEDDGAHAQGWGTGAYELQEDEAEEFWGEGGESWREVWAEEVIVKMAWGTGAYELQEDEAEELRCEGGEGWRKVWAEEVRGGWLPGCAVAMEWVYTNYEAYDSYKSMLHWRGSVAYIGLIKPALIGQPRTAATTVSISL